MAKFQPGTGTIVLEGIDTPTANTDAANKAYVDASGGGGDNITASGGLQRIDDDISIATGGVDTVQLAAGAVDTNRLEDDAVSSDKIADIAVKEEHLDATNAPTTGQVLTSATDTNQFTWTDPVDPGITSIVDGGHIDVSTTDGVATLTFDERYDLWNGKSDWTQINTGTPAGNNFLYDAGTQTITVPSLAGRAILEILLDARSGMAVHIRQENTSTNPSGFQSGFYQILSINATATPEQVVIRMLPDSSDIFDEIEGNTYQYELSILQFVTGGTLDNLTLTGLSDVDVSTPPTDGQILAFETSSGTFIPADNSGGGGQPASDYNNAPYGSLHTPDISYTYTTETSPVNEGEVSISTVDSPATGYAVLFRKEDVDAKFLQSIRYFQIGFGSPISFATYAISTISIADGVDPQLVTITIIDGPLDGNDLLATLPLNETALSISVANNEFEYPDLGDLTDVDLSTDPTDGQVLAYELSTDTWKAADAGSGGGDIGDLDDVDTGGVQDGFVLRYDGDDSTWKDHSISNTLQTYGGVSLNQDSDFSAPTSTGDNAIAIGDNATASADEATSVGAGTEATFASSSAFGHSSRAVHTNSTALGTGAITTEVDEVRLGDANAHTTVNPSVAGNESDDNQLVSKRWVNNQISDASRVISSTANALENLTIVTQSTPWDDFRIVPVDSLNDPSLEVHMYEFDATQPQFIFYAGFMSSSSFGTGAGLTTGTIPDFFEEVTDVANESEVTNADGESVTSLGFKYLGHDLATVWQAVSHVYTFNFDWIYPAGNSDGTQNPPDVTSSLELVRLKPTGSNTYNIASNATVVASSPTSFHNAGSIEPGNTETFTGSYEFAQQTLEDGISNVANGDVFAYRMKIRYKGNGFDGETNVRLAITESETTNFVPQIGIRHVGRDYSLVLEDSGDLQWTDHGSVDQSTLLLLENTTDGIEIPAATLGLVAGENITITGKTIASTASDPLTAGNGITIADDVISIDRDGANDTSGLSVGTDGISITLSNNSALSLQSDGLQLNTLRAQGTRIDTSGTNNTVAVALRGDLTNSGIAIGGSGTDAGLFLDLADSNSGLVRVSDGLQVDAGDGITIDTTGVTLDFRTETNNPLEVSGTGADAGLSLNIDEDGPLSKTTNGLDVTIETNGGLAIGSLSSGIEVLLPANSGLQTTATGLSLNAGINELTDVNIGTLADGQILEYDNATSMWVNTTLSGNHSFTAGTGLSFNTDGTVLNTDGNSIEYTSIGVTDGDSTPTVSNTSTREVAIGADTEVDGDRAVSIGYSASSDGNSSIAIGSGSSSIASNSLSIGANSNSGGLSTTAVGSSAIAISANATAVGSITLASGSSSSAFGRGASAAGDDGTALGRDSDATMTASTAVGFGAQATGVSSFAAGDSSGASGLNSVSIGNDSDATETSSTAIGDTAQATGTSSIALGESSEATGTDSSALSTDATASGTRSIAIGQNSNASGTNTVCVGNSSISSGVNSVNIGSATNGTGDRSIAIGSAAITGANVLGIAVGERATAGAIRGIAIGTSSNSASATADLCRADGSNSIAIGRASQALTSSTTAIGDGATVSATATGSTAIGNGASATLANTTVLGSGDNHRVFAGNNQLSSPSNQSGDANSISCSINNDFWQTPNNGFNPGSTSAEILRYTQVGDLAIGRFDFRLALDEDTAFQDGDRWTCNSTSDDMTAAFGYAVGTSAIALGTFVISGAAYNSAAMGDFWLHPDTTTALIRMSFRVRSVIGTAPARDSYISAQFNIAKF